MKLFDNGGVTMGDLPHINVDATGKLYKWERGQALPSLDNIVILAKLYEVTLDDLLVIE